MDKNEVITLSSDEETESMGSVERDSNTSVRIKPGGRNLSSVILKMQLEKQPKHENVIIKGMKNEVKSTKKPKVSTTQCEETNKNSPEIVDLVDFLDKIDEDVSPKSEQNHSELDIIDIDDSPLKKDSSIPEKLNTCENKTEGLCKNLPSNKIEIKPEKGTSDFISSTANSCNNSCETEGPKFEKCKDTVDEEFSQNLKFFTEFVEYCGSLEDIENDRIRLTRKLMKRYGEADSSYIKSQEFRYLIQKCRDKVNKSNLYLIAKEITEELIYRKKIAIDLCKADLAEEKSQRGNEQVEKHSLKLTKKRVRFINKIIKKLDKLGNKIRELEEQEVDLSDEEDSAYVLLQRYRERFCQIYKRLCTYTREVSGPNDRKICFTESKYPAINKCIENWLNKTKRFPDFTDIIKLIESQSSSLGLPSNKESVRAIAVELFQKVGAMLQRRRIYDLWETFCGFLDDGEDPADSNPALDQILKSNFEIRRKKEQEIFQHFTELQEKEKLEPEEVADEEANHSPVESGNEDDKEIEAIENCLNKRLDDAIKDTEDNGNILEKRDYDGHGNNSEIEGEFQKQESKSKETKNNYKNCKSLKYRLEKSMKGKSDSSNSEDSSTGTENEKEKPENEINSTKNRSNPKEKLEEVEKDDSDLELITVEDETKSNTKERINEVKKDSGCDITCKRISSLKMEEPAPKMKRFSNEVERKHDDVDIFEIDDESENAAGTKTNEVFGVHCCQIFADSVFQDMREEKKDWKKRKVFKDLTNVNKLMELHGKRKKMYGFSPSFFHRSFCEFEKSSWKRRFKVSFRLVGSKDQKYALTQEEEAGKTVNSDSGGDSDEKDIQSNSEGGGDDEGDNFFNSHGSGNEEDNNEDENKKSGGTNGDVNDKQHEEEEKEEEEEGNENEKASSVTNTESTEDSFLIKKTEEFSDTKVDNKTHSFVLLENGSDEDEQTTQNFVVESEPKISGEIDVENLKETREKSNNPADETEQNDEAPKDENEAKIEENKDEEKNILERESKYNSAEEMEAVEIVTEDVAEEESTSVTEGTDKKSEIPDEHLNEECRQEKTETKDDSVTTRSENHADNLEFKARESKKNESRMTTGEGCHPTTTWKSFESRSKKPRRINTPSTTDEERVKRFLMHSPSSISITPPKRLTLSKPPSQAALQALATLKNLKGISATIVRNKPRNEGDVLVVEDSCKRHSAQHSNPPTKRRRNELPVISNVQSIAATPTIVTVEGNVSGFEDGEFQCDSSSIRISNVWGNLPGNFIPSPRVESVGPECSSRQTQPNEKTDRKKNSKKTVEYVVLE